LFGSTVREERGDRLSLRNNRWTLTSDRYQIFFDQLPDYKERHEQLKSQGGYHLLYACRLEVLKGNFTLADQQKLFSCLNTFLSFINARKTSALLIKGIHQDEVIYEDITNYIVDPYKYVETWAPNYSVFNPQSAWEKFSVLWSNENHKHFLQSAVHWYVQANAQSGYIEGSIVLAQVALELIYNWFIIEEKKLISGDDAKNISASNKFDFCYP
jgi:hypothetical protein